jgi:alpha-D-ribose 1-methylphosphonate 5-triphosphate synthase subunit PhnL
MQGEAFKIGIWHLKASGFSGGEKQRIIAEHLSIIHIHCMGEPGNLDSHNADNVLPIF